MFVLIICWIMHRKKCYLSKMLHSTLHDTTIAFFLSFLFISNAAADTFHEIRPFSIGFSEKLNSAREPRENVVWNRANYFHRCFYFFETDFNFTFLLLFLALFFFLSFLYIFLHWHAATVAVLLLLMLTSFHQLPYDCAFGNFSSRFLHFHSTSPLHTQRANGSGAQL